MKKILIAVFSLVVVVGLILGLVAGGASQKAPEPKTVDELFALGDVCKAVPIAEKLYVLDAATFQSIEERHMAISLQGIVNKAEAKMFITTNEISHDYLKDISDSGIELVYNDENGERWTLESLLQKFKSDIGENGYVLYKPSEKAEGLNIATNLATINGWLPVPESLNSFAEAVGLELKEDLTKNEIDLEYQKSFFEQHKEKFNYNAVVSLKYEATGLRDLAIQQGFYMYYIDDDEDGTKLRGDIFEYAGEGTAALGWAKYEVQYVSQASKNGCYVLPSDHSHNNSVLASLDSVELKQKYTAQEQVDDSKHYCALVFSDGDNIQWIQNGYNEYFTKLALNEQFPVTWSFSPSMQEFSPVTAKKVYSSAGDEDYFIAGVSGAGYVHPTELSHSALTEFTDLTAANMLKSNLSYVSILDSTPNSSFSEKALVKSLEYYARYDNIKGGVLSLDPERYMGGEGVVYFVNDKPFISNRYSLWHPDGEGAEITTEWLDEQADIINNYPVDINTINGYSVINIHPWTISVENLAYFVSQLDENVELVTLDELFTMVEKNIPHETAKPS